MNRRSRSRRPLRIAMLFAFGASITTAAAVHADTIHLKGGTFIPDCKVVRSTDTIVYVRTPVGDMGVPRNQIQRIVRKKTVFDVYRERLARLRKKDVHGLYKLSLWCRTQDGLRKESNELAARVFAINEKHKGARRLLGHIPVRGRWYVPRPLSVYLNVERLSPVEAATLRMQVANFLAGRDDVRVVSSLEGLKPLDAAHLDISVGIGSRAGTKFYGTKIGRDFIRAKISLSTRSTWNGRRPPRGVLAGEIQSGVPNARTIAIQNALGKGHKALHRFLDQTLVVRAKGIHEILSKKLDKKKREASKNRRSAGKKRKKASSKAK